MKKIFISLEKNKINLLGENFSETILDLGEYEDVLKNISTNKYSYFKKLHQHDTFDKEYIDKQYLPLFNYILLNNMANYIMDKVLDNEYNLIFSNCIDSIKEEAIKVTGILKGKEILNDIFNILRNYNSKAVNYIKKEQQDFSEIKIDSQKKLEDIFYYTSLEVKKLKEKLEEDLIAFNYVEKNKKNNFNRYELPVYIDEKGFKDKGIECLDIYVKSWESIAYLQMLTKIHDHFSSHYNLNLAKGLNIDVLTIALLELLDSKILDYPKGLKKSVEVGRSTSGKCFFVDKVLVPMSLSVDLVLILQGKDLYSVVTRISKNNRT